MPRALITAGTIYTGDPPRPGATAMVVDRGRITWTGPATEVPRPVPRERIDLGDDAVVIPGLVDSHQHLLDSQLLTGFADLRGVRSPEEAAERLRTHAASQPEGWITGWGYDAAETDGGRRPDGRLLDTVSADRPVIVMESSFHQGAGNSAALAAIGFGRDTPQSFGGEMERDRRGEPTGILWERAFSVLAWAGRKAELERLGPSSTERTLEACRTLLAQGITHVGEALASRDDIERLQNESLPLGFTLMPASGNGAFATPWDALDGPRSGQGTPHMGIGHLKLFSDGGERCALSIPLSRSLRQTTAIVRSAISDRDPTSLRVLTTAKATVTLSGFQSGTLHYAPGKMADIMSAALQRGFTVAVHALGNLGVRSALDAYQEARSRTGIDVAGCRIEHATFIDDADLERAADLGLRFSMQPGHAVAYVRTLRITKIERFMDPVAMRKVIDAGIPVAISSDGPTAPGSALDNMRGAWDRIAVDGKPIRRDLAITKTEALRAATAGGAEACGVAEVKGSLTNGKQADFAVLNGDPFDPATRVRQTWVAGAKAWEQPAPA